MGAYVYRVTAKQVTCSDGQKANVAVFAYKPHGWDGEKLNAKLHFSSGCVASERLSRGTKMTGRVVMGDAEGNIHTDSGVFENVSRLGYFYDDIFGSANMPKMVGVDITANTSTTKRVGIPF